MSNNKLVNLQVCDRSQTTASKKKRKRSLKSDPKRNHFGATLNQPGIALWAIVLIYFSFYTEKPQLEIKWHFLLLRERERERERGGEPCVCEGGGGGRGGGGGGGGGGSCSLEATHTHVLFKSISMLSVHPLDK